MHRGDYEPVANERPARSPDEEMDQAFESDDEDSDSTPLTHATVPSNQRLPTLPSRQNSGTYDFEREYDHPPPGSPPPQASALSRAVGNTNGVLPNPANVQRNFPTPASRQSFFRRTVGALLPQHYARVPTTDSSDVRGSGVENDGVFSNVLAKPSRPTASRTANGEEIQEMSEDAQKDAPPVRMRLALATPHH